MAQSEFDGAFKKKQPVRLARRRQQNENEEDESMPSPVAGNKKSGWDESANDEGTVVPAAQLRRRRSMPEDDEDEDEPATKNRHDDDDDDIEQTPIIPDLEDEQEDMARQVASAPSLKSSRVPPIQELDAEIDMSLPSVADTGVDLSVLQAFLMPTEQVAEEDVLWDPEREIAQLSSDMTLEQTEAEGDAAVVLAAAAPANAPLRKRGAAKDN